MNVNTNLVVDNETRMKSGIMIYVGASEKNQENIMHIKKIIFGILLHVVVKMSNI